MTSLQTLKKELVSQYGSYKQERCINTDHTESREEILRQIEDVILRVMKDTANGTSPLLTYSSTSDWSDVSFGTNSGLEMRRNQRMTTVRFESLQSVKKLGLMMKVLSVMYRLVKTNHYCTKRDIYYQDPSLFGSQHTLDGIVDNISCMLEIPRWELHVLATSKGCLAGDLLFQDVDNNYIDCRQTQMGVQVPNHVNGMHNIVSNADFILVVEKDATFQKLLQDKVCEKLHPCIIITGKGFPDINTRMLLKKLWDNFSIPILVLVDADPHGIEIMTVYKFGSKALSFETEHLAVPCIKWLGILPSDIFRLGIPETSLIPLSKADRIKGLELLSRPYIQHYPLWRNEIENMLASGRKAEIQALDSISSSFLTDVYLPSKIRCSGWI
ncbi:meiotic recombination protein SPO11-like [Mercenaria mercenaria]|uniref:meiotic recombination protein SPO11-like n=1 Tax=Mercenaria mercenaria TaxID=6596 RepID=UPI00234E4B1B|nr:meiotic recombination protein SPO11-like [Mercenaria mercenaria]